MTDSLSSSNDGTHPTLLVTLHKLDKSTQEEALADLPPIAIPPSSSSSSSLTSSVIVKPPTPLRRDVVQSKDDERCYYVVDTVLSTSSVVEPYKTNTDMTKNGNANGNGKNETAAATTTSHWKVFFPDPTPRYQNFRTTMIDSDPLYFIVFFYIKSDYVTPFIDLIQQEGRQVQQCESRTCLRFDLLQSLDEPTQFIVMEVVKDWDAVRDHHSQDYYQHVRQALVDMQARPRSHDRGYRVVLSQSFLT